MTGATEGSGPAVRRLLVVALHLAIVALLLWLGWRFARGLDLGLLRSRLGEVGAGWLVLMVLGLVARLPIWTERWLWGVRSAGLVAGRLRSMGGLAASMAVNTVTPSARVAGGLVRARFLAAEAGCGFGVAYGTVLVDQLAHHTGMAVLSVALVASLAGGLAPASSIGIAATAMGAALVAAAWWLRPGRDGSRRSVVDRLLARMRRRLEQQAERQPRLGAALAGGGDALEITARLLRDRRVLVAAALGSTALFLVGGWVQWLVFRALELPVSLAAALAVVGIGGFAGVVAGTPGGAGGAEAVMIAALAALGVSPEDATAATLLFRGLHYAVVLGLGLPLFVFLEWLVRRAKPS